MHRAYRAQPTQGYVPFPKNYAICSSINETHSYAPRYIQIARISFIQYSHVSNPEITINTHNLHTYMYSLDNVHIHKTHRHCENAIIIFFFLTTTPSL